MDIFLAILIAVLMHLREPDPNPGNASASATKLAKDIYDNKLYTLDEDGGVVITDEVWP